MDVTLIDFILKHPPVNLGYTIIRTMLSIPNWISRALPYGNFITQILKYFRVPINESSCKPCESIGDEVVYASGFKWHNGAWVKYTEIKYTMLSLSDYRPLNYVVLANQLPDFSLPFRGQNRCEDPLHVHLIIVLLHLQYHMQSHMTLAKLLFNNLWTR